MKVKKVLKIVGLSIVCIIIIVVGILALLLSGITRPGNKAIYSVEQSNVNENSTLKGKKILFLGSSVTYGTGFKGTSFVDYLVKMDGVDATKEAVVGTTLVDNGKNSYVARLKKVDKSLKFDAFVCQLSTNDATKKLPLGKISTDGKYDTSTIAGAIEEVISYVKETWNCPIIFYTGTYYDDVNYDNMVKLTIELESKWGIKVIDLWNDKVLNDISDADRKLYMVNDIHPSKAGYKLWWLPVIERELEAYLK